MMRLTRTFFEERGLIEVDCPLLSKNASVDAHIDLIPALFQGNERCYLHSSPEYGMKRLIAEGIGDCYQLSHVFRDGEHGIKHNPEFTLIEWYRIGIDFDAFIEETIALIQVFLGPLPFETIAYREAFQKFLGIDPFAASESELLKLLDSHQISYYSSLEREGKDALLNLLLGTLVEPHLGKDSLLVLRDYPASQAALAKTDVSNGYQIARRFEVYHKGIELANGYDELADALEQRRRFEEANEARLTFGKEKLPIDEAFLAALEQGLPSCCGVAVGFDRLMMLRQKVAKLADILPFDWTLA